MLHDFYIVLDALELLLEKALLLADGFNFKSVVEERVELLVTSLEQVDKVFVLNFHCLQPAV